MASTMPVGNYEGSLKHTPDYMKLHCTPLTQSQISGASKIERMPMGQVK
jgi:hypothetical protein